MKILFLPLFKMPSGHHRVADALIGMIQARTKKIECKKVDLLSYSSESLEKNVSQIYLKWINRTPKSYDWAYKHFAYTKSHKNRTFKGIELFFLHHLQKLLEEERPDTVVCTHGFPSLLMSKLKNKGQCNIPVINVYTDFFINDIWGREGIDYHLVPNLETKTRMVEHYGIKETTIFVSGIPIHEIFNETRSGYRVDRTKTILVAGGSSGLGDMTRFIKPGDPKRGFRYIVLCGNNQDLYRRLKQQESPHICPLPYVASREEMNKLYDEVDAIITKPGGVTVSEALKKHLPIFIHSALPGQEHINLQYLKEKNLVYELNQVEDVETQIARIIYDELEMRKWERAVTRYTEEMQMASTRMLFNFLYANMMEGVYLNSLQEQIIKKRGFVSAIKKVAKKISTTSNI